MNKIIETILNRKSCRNFNKRKVNDEKLDLILQCGIHAPSGKNMQCAEVIAVSNSKVVNKIKKVCLKEMNRDCFYGAKTIVIVKAPKGALFKIQDGSCMLENMMVAATALKIHSCWINQLNQLLMTKSGMKLKEELHIGDEDEVIGCLSLGYMDDESTLKVARKNPERIIKIK